MHCNISLLFVANIFFILNNFILENRRTVMVIMLTGNVPENYKSSSITNFSTQLVYSPKLHGIINGMESACRDDRIEIPLIYLLTTYLPLTTSGIGFDLRVA